MKQRRYVEDDDDDDDGKSGQASASGGPGSAQSSLEGHSDPTPSRGRRPLRSPSVSPRRIHSESPSRTAGKGQAAEAAAAAPAGVSK